MQEELVAQGFNLMFTGMGTVLTFLGLLVVLTKLSSGFVSRFFPDQEPISVPKPRLTSQASSAVNATTLKVIQQAIKEHKASTSRK